MESVTEKFLRYVKVDTQSDELSETFPSTKKTVQSGGNACRRTQKYGSI